MLVLLKTKLGPSNSRSLELIVRERVKVKTSLSVRRLEAVTRATKQELSEEEESGSASASGLLISVFLFLGSSVSVPHLKDCSWTGIK